MPSLNFDDDPVGRPKDQWQRAISGLGAGVIMVVFVVVIFGAGYAMVHHAKRSAIFQRQASLGKSSRPLVLERSSCCSTAPVHRKRKHPESTPCPPHPHPRAASSLPPR